MLDKGHLVLPPFHVNSSMTILTEFGIRREAVVPRRGNKRHTVHSTCWTSSLWMAGKELGDGVKGHLLRSSFSHTQ